jgi:two-component system chemotaxis response regulator CheB
MMPSKSDKQAGNDLVSLSARHYKLVVIGASWGGLSAISKILKQLPANFSLPILIAQHRYRHRRGEEYLVQALGGECKLKVIEPDDKEVMQTSTVYVAPSNYHLLVEQQGILALSSDELIHFSRPALDPLFESAADAYQHQVIGIILTGANSDGAKGLYAIKKQGGLTIVQNPASAEAVNMPEAAIKMTEVDAILELEQIADLLVTIDKNQNLARF